MGFLHSQLFVTPHYPDKSFSGQTVIVTGSNVGLGKEAARHLTRLGAAKVILACRNTRAAEEAKRDILSTTKVDASVVEVWPFDLGSYESVKAFAARASQLPRLDAVIENAGIAAMEFVLAEGHESTITVNVISTFLLALLLIPKLKADAQKYNFQPRLSIVTSEVHGFTKFEERNAPNIFAKLDENVKGAMDQRYPVSKLLEVLVVRQIAPKLRGTGIILNMINPGLCKSSLSRNAKSIRKAIFVVMLAVLARTTEVGSRTLVAGAEAGEESHGKYMTDGHVAEEALSQFVKSDAGAKAGEKVWSELSEILNEIQPGVVGNL